MAKEAVPKLTVQENGFSIGEILKFESKILGERRTLNVYLPNSYEASSDQKYPVIYLLDGSAEQDFIHVAGLVQFCSLPGSQIIPETIVVGIANSDRQRDFTFPSNNENAKTEFPNSGGSARFIRFLQEEVQSIIGSKYRIKNESTLIGQSFGGLLAAEILFTNPGLFDHYVIISPCLWWDDESLLKRELQSLDSVKSIYVGVGKQGELLERVARDLLAKTTKYKSRQTKPYFKFFEKQSRGDVLHLAIYDAFEKLFRRPESNGT